MNFKWCLLFLSGSLCAHFGPWGPEAELFHSASESKAPSPLAKGAVWVLKQYQSTLSTSDCKKCLFHPSCSQYTLEAIQKYGLIQGWMMGCDRLMRSDKEDACYDLICVGEYRLNYDPLY